MSSGPIPTRRSPSRRTQASCSRPIVKDRRFRRLTVPAMGYHPALDDMMTGFVTSGAGVRGGAVIPLLPLEHIAPFVAALLGIDLPDIDGTLLPGLLWTKPEVAPSRRP
jgi:hypothetical protein